MLNNFKKTFSQVRKIQVLIYFRFCSVFGFQEKGFQAYGFGEMSCTLDFEPFARSFAMNAKYEGEKRS